jgi:undecaprenyl-diphosphatase
MQIILEIIKYLIVSLFFGATEILPLSGLGHFFILGNLFRLEPELMIGFLFILNFAVFLSVGYFFRKDIRQLLTSLFRYFIKREETSKDDTLYFSKLLIAAIPFFTAWLFFKSYLPSDLLSIGFAMIINSGMLYFVYRIQDIQWKNDISTQNALSIGLFKAFSVFPGLSYIAMGLSGGLAEKIDLKRLIKFIFLSYLIYSLPIIIISFIIALQCDYPTHFGYYILGFISALVASQYMLKLVYHKAKVRHLIYVIIYALIMGLLTILIPLL